MLFGGKGLPKNGTRRQRKLLERGLPPTGLLPIQQETAESMVLNKVRQYNNKAMAAAKQKKLRGYALEENMPMHRRQRSVVATGTKATIPNVTFKKTAGVWGPVPVKQATFDFQPDRYPNNKGVIDDDCTTIATAATCATTATGPAADEDMTLV